MTRLKPSLYPSKLAAHGIELLDRERALQDDVRLRCRRCGATWSCDSRTGGHLPPGYWKCPNGCNTRSPAG
jgi:hypothetical protein